MDISIILIIVVLGIYLAWKLMGSSKSKKPSQRRFSIRNQRKKRRQLEFDDEDDV